MTGSSQNNIKAIFFDIGGTLIQKQNHGYRNLNVIKQMVDLLQTDCSPEALLEMINAGEVEYRAWREFSFIELAPEEKWQRFLLKEFSAELVRDKAAELQRLWRQSRGKRWLAPHAVETVKELSARGYILATISHSTPEYLHNTELEKLFCAQVYAPSYGKRKPHPSIFLAAAAQCQIPPAECAYIGDRPSRDLIGSREAGFGKVILVKNEYTTPESTPCPMHADAIISDVSELLDLFLPLSLEIKENTSISKPPTLYDAALSSINWDREATTINEFFHARRELGFARFELNHQVPQEIFDQIDFNRYHFSTLHNPCPAILPMKQLEKEDRLLTSLNEHLRQSGVDVLKNTIENAWRLGARSIVIHSGWVSGNNNRDRELWRLYEEGKQDAPEFIELRRDMIADRSEHSKPHLEQLIKSYNEIVEFTKGSNLLLGIENLMHYYELPNFEEMQVLMDTFKQPWVGWQFDTGHLQIQHNLGLESIPAWLEAFGERMVGIHLHDVAGITDHIAPGKGQTDFHPIGARIQPFTQITIEVKPFVTAAEIEAGLPILEAAGCISRL